MSQVLDMKLFGECYPTSNHCGDVIVFRRSLSAGEAKQRVGTLREEMEVKQGENQQLQDKFLQLSSEHESQLSRNQQVYRKEEVQYLISIGFLVNFHHKLL